MIIGAVAGVALGAALGYALFTRILKAQASNVIAKAEQKGENIKDKKNPSSQGEIHPTQGEAQR